MAPAVIGAQAVASRVFGGLLQRFDDVADRRFGFGGHQQRHRARYVRRRHRSPVHIGVLEHAVRAFFGRDAGEDLRAGRDNARARSALDALKRAAEGTANTMPYILDAVRAYATVGEICDVFRETFGTYQETSVL